MAFAGSLPQPRDRFPRALFRAGRGAGAAALRNRAGEGRGGTPAAGHPGDALPGGLGARACVTLGLPPGMRRDGSAVRALRSAGGRGPWWLPARMVRYGPFREEGVSG